MRLAIAAAAIAVAATGCGLLGDSMPAFVANRQPVPACGEETSSHGEARNVAGRQCLLDAFRAGGKAEFIVTEDTVEGDPITRIIRVLGPDQIQIFVDATRDSWGSGQWEEVRCSRLVPIEEFNDPPDTVMPANMVFIEDGCEPL
jgi:hypothetical protein